MGGLSSACPLDPGPSPVLCRSDADNTDSMRSFCNNYVVPLKIAFLCPSSSSYLIFSASSLAMLFETSRGGKNVLFRAENATVLNFKYVEQS